MKICLAANIFPPEVGGPAPYAAALRDALEQGGHEVRVVAFSRYLSVPTGLRHLLYTIALFRATRGVDGIIAFDVITVGLPSVIVSFVRRMPVVARVGGDFLWERYVEQTGDLVPLPAFYAHKDRWRTSDRFLKTIASFVLGHVRVAFSTQWIANLWQQEYGLEASNVRVIENALPPRTESAAPLKKNFLLYGRAIKLKNVEAFTRAFEAARKNFPDIELECGKIAQENLQAKIRASYAVAVPSISEVSPNTVIDAIRAGKPFLLTKHSGYAQRFGDLGVIVDPLDERDMQRGIEALVDPDTYRKYADRILAVKETRTYKDIASEFLRLLTESSSGPLR
ncbi:MAG: glycosyltransferase family 4 protein [Candidatus Kaiserbacteria bacterium]|nr:MAG: glycosyltransferase family 4 protein [Candidatus Kaiserbacteria bacterium]